MLFGLCCECVFLIGEFGVFNDFWCDVDVIIMSGLDEVIVVLCDFIGYGYY